MYPLWSRGTSLTCGSSSARLPDRSWNSGISLSPRVTRGSDGPGNALLSSLALFTNPALSSHQSRLSPPSLVSWPALNTRLARTAGQAHWSLPPVFSLHPRGSGRSVLPRSPGHPSQTRGAGLTQRSPGAGEPSVSSLALDTSEAEDSLDPVLSVPARRPVFTRSSPHALEASGPGAASVPSLPGRSGRPRPAQVSNTANPARVSPGPGLALVTNISLGSHQSHLAGVSHPALSAHQAGYSSRPRLSVLPVLARLAGFTRFPCGSHQPGPPRESSETNQTCRSGNSDISVRPLLSQGASLAQVSNVTLRTRRTVVSRFPPHPGVAQLSQGPGRTGRPPHTDGSEMERKYFRTFSVKLCTHPLLPEAPVSPGRPAGPSSPFSPFIPKSPLIPI